MPCCLAEAGGSGVWRGGDDGIGQPARAIGGGERGLAVELVVVFLAGLAAAQDLTAGHLPVTAQLAGALLPHGHGQAPPPLPPGHERGRGVE